MNKRSPKIPFGELFILTIFLFNATAPASPSGEGEPHFWIFIFGKILQCFSVAFFVILAARKVTENVLRANNLIEDEDEEKSSSEPDPDDEDEDPFE